jgi:hypothetical protein
MLTPTGSTGIIFHRCRSRNSLDLFRRLLGRGSVPGPQAKAALVTLS